MTLFRRQTAAQAARLRRISKKMAVQKRAEARLKKRMVEKAHPWETSVFVRCAMCGRLYAWLAKHEIKPRSLGGDPLDEANCVLLCQVDHDIEKDPARRHHSRSDFPFANPAKERAA